MSPLTPDERAEIAGEMRASGRYLPMRRAVRMGELADKLEAEAEPDLMSALARSLTEKKLERVERERDGAREALRDLLLTIAEMSQHPLSDARGAAVVERARAVLEGVERAHG